MTCESCKQHIQSSPDVMDFKRLTLLDIKYDRGLPFGHQALERLYACCNCGKRWHVSLSRKWPTDPLPEQTWWVETPGSTLADPYPRNVLHSVGEESRAELLAGRPGLRRVRRTA